MALNRNAGGELPDRDPELDRVYALGEREEPPARLDDAIRAAARREVGARPSLPGKAWRAWRVPVSLAAVLVLSVSVVMLMRQEGADRLAEVAPPAAAPPLEHARPAHPVEPPTKPEPSQRAQPAREAANQLRDAPASEAAPASVEKDRRRKEQNATGTTADIARSAGSPGLAPQPFPVPQPAAPEPPASAPPVARSQAGVLAKQVESGAAVGPAVPERPASAPQAAAEARGPAAELATQPKPFVQPPAPKAAEKRRRDDTATDANRPIWAGYERQPPEKWLARIEELRRSGSEAEAREMLEEFKRRFPEHPLPAALTR